MKTLEELEVERMAWSRDNFPEADVMSSLIKLEGEVEEVRKALFEFQIEEEGAEKQEMWGGIIEEYADCLMYLFDSAGRAGITPAMLRDAFENKMAKNKARTWVKNPDNTYSHVKI